MLSVQHKTGGGTSIFWLFLAFGMVGGNADEKAKRMVRTEAEPQYVRNENYPTKWFRVLQKGIDTTRDYLGNYGPLCVYIIGQEQEELKSDKVAKKIVDAYCRNRHGEASDRLSDCLKHKGVSLIERARDGSTEAYLISSTSHFQSWCSSTRTGFRCRTCTRAASTNTPMCFSVPSRARQLG